MSRFEKNEGGKMWRINSTAQGLELRGKTLCFIVFLVLSGQAFLYYAIRMLLSEF
jgi:hypothetical protein